MSDAPPDFTGDLEGFLAWHAEHAKWNPHWCAKHWAPCPVEGKNGLLASILQMQTLAFRGVPADVEIGPALNSWLANQTEPTCCRAGDDEMAKLWALVDALAEDDEVAIRELKGHFGLPIDKPPRPLDA